MAASKDVEVDAGTLTEADIPMLLALAVECAAAVPGRTEVKIVGSMRNVPVSIEFVKDGQP